MTDNVFSETLDPAQSVNLL